MSNAARIVYFSTTNNHSNDSYNYLKKLFGRCREGYIEIRQISAQGMAKQKWISVINPNLPVFPNDQNIYIGVATRLKGGGTKEDIVQIPAVWVDIDFKNTLKKEAYEIIKNFQLKPSMIVESGHGLHLYWILETPAEKKDISKIEDINQRLLIYFHGDNVMDASRILRLPGTYNQKYDPPRLATLSSINGNVYDLSEFDCLPPVPPAVSQAVSTVNPPSIYTSMLDGVREGQRHTTLVSLAGHYRSISLPEDETQKILALWNEKNQPPLDENELTSTIKDNYKRYGHANNNPTEGCLKIIEQSVISIHDLMGKTIEEKSVIIEPWLRAGEIGMISATRGIGKTWLALSIGLAATHEMTIGKWKTGTPTGCLYIDGEMAEYWLQSRLFQLKLGLPESKAEFKLLSADSLRSCQKPSPKLTDENWRNAILYYLKKNNGIRLLILDNLASLTPGVEENAKKDWDQINQWLLDLRSIGTAVIMIHHTGKNGDQRGTSSREDALDFSIKLKRPEGYTQNEGANFIVEFTKNRGLCGDAVKSFHLSLNLTVEGVNWKVECKAEERENSIIASLNEGLKQKEIARKEGVSPSYVSQVKRNALRDGKLNVTDNFGKEDGDRKMEDEENIKESERGGRGCLDRKQGFISEKLFRVHDHAAACFCD